MRTTHTGAIIAAACCIMLLKLDIFHMTVGLSALGIMVGLHELSLQIMQH